MSVKGTRKGKPESPRPVDEQLHVFYRDLAAVLPYGSLSRAPEHQTPETARLEMRWVTGGVRRAMTFGDSESTLESVSAEPEPEFESLDLVLERYIPDIRLLEYKRLLRMCEVHGDDDGGDFYGNRTTYSVRSLAVSDLYLFLKERGCLKPV